MLPPVCFLFKGTAPLPAVPAADLVALHQKDLPHHPLLLLRVDVDKAAAVKVSAILLACPQDLAPQDKGRVMKRSILYAGVLQKPVPKAQSIDESLKAATSDLAALKELALDDICNQVNTKMYELNKKIYGDSRRAPTLNIHGDRYSFSTYGDTGTGTAFANLITFDLALLDLTCLPAVAHDLPLLKNIENPAMEKIILLYAASKKQIFIAIDKIHSYDKVASSVVETHGVIQLSKDKTLFIKNWKKATT